MRLIIASFVTAILLPAAATAQGAAPIDQLIRSMGMLDVLEIMAEEGKDYGAELQQDLLQGRGGQRWAQQVEAIYEVHGMTAMFRTILDTELAADDLGPMIDFFVSSRGQEIVALEVSAREAFMGEGIEEAGLDIFRQMEARAEPRVEKIKDLVEDLDERFLVGTSGRGDEQNEGEDGGDSHALSISAS